jgi:mRNA-degrading endonuclease toxin of MazEF toxin-antitoxin module
MTQPLRCGQIVWAEVADINGVRKARPVVIVTPDDCLTTAEPLEAVAITSRLPQPLPADHVLLPCHAQGHPRTGLNRKCAVVCTWLTRIKRQDILNVVGIVPGSILLDIARRIAGSRPGPPEMPPPEERSSET